MKNNLSNRIWKLDFPTTPSYVKKQNLICFANAYIR